MHCSTLELAVLPPTLAKVEINSGGRAEQQKIQPEKQRSKGHAEGAERETQRLSSEHSGVLGQDNSHWERQGLQARARNNPSLEDFFD